MVSLIRILLRNIWMYLRNRGTFHELYLQIDQCPECRLGNGEFDICEEHTEVIESKALETFGEEHGL